MSSLSNQAIVTHQGTIRLYVVVYFITMKKQTHEPEHSLTAKCFWFLTREQPASLSSSCVRRTDDVMINRADSHD